MKNITVIRHTKNPAFGYLGSLGANLLDRDDVVTYLDASVDNLDSFNPLAPDILIVLGGPIGAYEERNYPFLIDEMRFLERRLDADLPTLGICLGSQLIARTLGAKVYPGLSREVGWSPLQLTNRGIKTPLAHLVAENTPMFHWHGDTFDLPVGATHLAYSSKFQNQAFSWGKRILALQFHPEVTALGLEQWFKSHAREISAKYGIDIEDLQNDTMLYSKKLEPQAVKFWQAWLKSVTF